VERPGKRKHSKFDEKEKSMPAKQKCQWYLEKAIVTKAELGDEAQKALDKVIDALVKAVDAGTAEFEALKTAFKELGLTGGDNVDVTLLYACEDNNGKISRRKKILADSDSVNWAAKFFRTGNLKASMARTTIINRNKPAGSCCKASRSAIATQQTLQKSKSVRGSQRTAVASATARQKKLRNSKSKQKAVKK
jgi:hypothetical protein